MMILLFLRCMIFVITRYRLLIERSMLDWTTVVHVCSMIKVESPVQTIIGRVCTWYLLLLRCTYGSCDLSRVAGVAERRSGACQRNINLRHNLVLPSDYISLWIHLIPYVFGTPNCLKVILVGIGLFSQILINGVCNTWVTLIYFLDISFAFLRYVLMSNGRGCHWMPGIIFTILLIDFLSFGLSMGKQIVLWFILQISFDSLEDVDTYMTSTCGDLISRFEGLIISFICLLTWTDIWWLGFFNWCII